MTQASLEFTAPTTARRTTGIEWTDHTWNPFVGCSRESEGCRNCYAETLANRLQAMGQVPYKGTSRKGKWTGKINRSSDATMRKPYKIHGPAFVFVNSMSDFWHPNANDAWRAEALEIMADRPELTFQILTKRPQLVAEIMARMGIKRVPDNVWLGATVEDGRVADRIPHVARFPSLINFLSVEPIVAPFGKPDLSGISWAIGGGESGPGARPMRPEWVRELRDLCQHHDVPFFWKQYGKIQNNPLVIEQGMSHAAAALADPIGKGGSLIDGRAWKEMPIALQPSAPHSRA